MPMPDWPLAGSRMRFWAKIFSGVNYLTLRQPPADLMREKSPVNSATPAIRAGERNKRTSLVYLMPGYNSVQGEETNANAT